MRRQLVDHIAMSGKITSNRARAVLSLVNPNTDLDQEIRMVIDRHLALVNLIELEEGIKSLAMLEEVFACEHFANSELDCISANEHGQKILTIRGYIPPYIEIYGETTSFRPATFRPDGCPGTDTWFDQYGGLNPDGFCGETRSVVNRPGSKRQ